MPTVAERMDVNVWRNTSRDAPIASTRFGLRLGVPLRNAWVDRGASTVELQLEGGPTLTIELRAAFWNKCPEFKHAEIGPWLQAQKIAIPWPLGNPPTFVMERISGTRFLVLRFTPLEP